MSEVRAKTGLKKIQRNPVDRKKKKKRKKKQKLALSLIEADRAMCPLSFIERHFCAPVPEKGSRQVTVSSLPSRGVAGNERAGVLAKKGTGEGNQTTSTTERRRASGGHSGSEEHAGMTTSCCPERIKLSRRVCAQMDTD